MTASVQHSTTKTKDWAHPQSSNISITSVQLKGTPSEDTGWTENVEMSKYCHMQALYWFFGQYFTFGFYSFA